MEINVPPAALVTGQGFREDFPDVIRGLGQQEVQNHGKVIPDLAEDIFRRQGQEFPDMNNIHEPAGMIMRKPIRSCPRLPARPVHLVEFRSPQGLNS